MALEQALSVLVEHHHCTGCVCCATTDTNWVCAMSAHVDLLERTELQLPNSHSAHSVPATPSQSD